MTKYALKKKDGLNFTREEIMNLNLFGKTTMTKVKIGQSEVEFPHQVHIETDQSKSQVEKLGYEIVEV